MSPLSGPRRCLISTNVALTTVRHLLIALLCVLCEFVLFVIQMIVRCQRPTTTVHLAGSFIISHVALAGALHRSYAQ